MISQEVSLSPPLPTYAHAQLSAPPIYSMHPPPPYFFLQWADVRDPPSDPSLSDQYTAQSRAKNPALDTVAHPRLLGAMGIAPPLLDKYLEKCLMKSDAPTIQSVCDHLLKHTVSRIKQWLDLHHARPD